MSWRGWLVLGVAFVAAVLAVRAWLQPFLAVTDTVTCHYLVVEGWAPDYALRLAAEEFRRGSYRMIFCTGGPLEQGSLLAEHKTYAEVAARSLEKLGVPPEAIAGVPAGSRKRGRTWGSAVALGSKIEREKMAVDGINIVTVGVHARRTRLLFRRALGAEIPVGVISVPPRDYDPQTWWQSSYGLKDVLGETVGCVGEWFNY